MFGYVRPMTCELKVKEFDAFRSCYCSLCRELGREYGPAARMVLNYDFTLLAMLLWRPDSAAETVCRRCAVRPARRICTYRGAEALEVSAGYSVILAWWKLKDARSDGTFGEACKAAGAMLFLGRAYRKARKKYPDFDASVAGELRELDELERAGERSLDRMADKFARLLSYAASNAGSAAEKRVLAQLLYHLGRWIYITDAADDLKRDEKSGAYNAVARHFGLTGGALDSGQKELLRATLTQSSNLCIKAFELMPETVWTPVIRNILYLGLPSVGSRVLAGTFRKDSGRFPDQNGER